MLKSYVIKERSVTWKYCQMLPAEIVQGYEKLCRSQICNIMWYNIIINRRGKGMMCMSKDDKLSKIFKIIVIAYIYR